MIRNMLTQWVFLEKLNAKTKSIAIFIWTTDLQTLVLVCPSLVPLPRKDSGGSRMGQEGDAEGPPLLFFFLLSPFSSVTCSYPAHRGIVSPKSVCALTQMLVALLYHLVCITYFYIVFGQYLLRYCLLSGTASSYSVDDGGIPCGSLSCITSTSLRSVLAHLVLLCSLKAPLSSTFPSKFTSTGMSWHTCCPCSLATAGIWLPMQLSPS